MNWDGHGSYMVSLIIIVSPRATFTVCLARNIPDKSSLTDLYSTADSWLSLVETIIF